jgi:hypothetical protein
MSASGQFFMSADIRVLRLCNKQLEYGSLPRPCKQILPVPVVVIADDIFAGMGSPGSFRSIRSMISRMIGVAVSRGELSIRTTPSMGCTNVEMLMAQVGAIPSPFAVSIIEQGACALDAGR